MKHILYTIKDRETLDCALMNIRAECDAFHPLSTLLHFFCGTIYAPENSELLQEIRTQSAKVLPEAELIGLSSGAEILEANVTEPCILLSVFLFQQSRIRVLSFPEITAKEKKAGEQLLQETALYPDLKGVELLLAGQIDSAPIYESLVKCREMLPFFGGYAVDHNKDHLSAFLLTKEGILTSSMAAVLYFGKELHIDPGRTTGWKPLGKTFRVTSASGRHLFSVNGIPAYELYQQFLHIPEGESIREYTKEFPLMLRKRKMKLLRHPQEKYADSSILLDGTVKEGDEICLSYGAPVEIIQNINHRCEKIREFEPEAILIYSCQGRRNYWGDLISWEMEPFQKVAETGGACLDGQIMRNNQTGRVIEHRLTLLSIAFREGEKTGRHIPEIAVDEELLKGRMSLVHKMSTLIESTVAELQKTNDILFGMNERLARANDELHRVAITDELTGLYNRREIERRVKDALEKAKTDHRSISLIMLDIDFFKKVNDTFGHDVGDLVLKEVSAILRENINSSHGEAVGRWGGEEFFMLLPDKGMTEALTLAEKIRNSVEVHDFPKARHLTISLGVTSTDVSSNYQAIFIQADQALYQAKNTGRNRVVGM